MRKQREKELEEKQKFKRFRTAASSDSNKQQTNGVVKIDDRDQEQMEINEYYEISSAMGDREKSELKFVPRAPLPKENLPMPIGRNHTRGAQITPIPQKGTIIL